MAYDSKKDELLKEIGAQISKHGDRLIVEVRRYNQGEPKISIVRMVEVRGKEQPSKLGRITAEEANWLVSVLPRAVEVLAPQ